MQDKEELEYRREAEQVRYTMAMPGKSFSDNYRTTFALLITSKNNCEKSTELNDRMQHKLIE